MLKPVPCVLLVTLCASIFFSCSLQGDTQPSAVAEQSTTLHEVIPVPDVVSAEVPAKEVHIPKQGPQIERVLRGFGPQPETYTFDPQQRIVITCAQGSRVEFDPGSFVYSGTHTEVVDPVEISVTEYLSDADILLGGLTTMCGKELLETAGMLYISAEANGKALALKDGYFYGITLPSQGTKDGMQLFYGNESDKGLDWLLAARGTFMENQNYNTAWNSYTDLKKWEEKPSGKVNFPGGIKKMYEYLHERIELPAGFEHVKLSATSYVNLTVDAKGKLSKIYTPKQIMTYGDAQLVEIFSGMPDWEASLLPSEKKKLLFPIKMDYVRDPSQITITENAGLRVDAMNYSATNIADGLLLTSSKLGWINCDRFTQPGNELVAMFIPVDSTVDATVRIVFDDIKSVMGGTRYTNGFVITNVPKDEPITIVSTIFDQGKIKVATEKTKVEERTYAELIYNEVNKQQLIDTFSSLRKSLADAGATAMR